MLINSKNKIETEFRKRIPIDLAEKKVMLVEINKPY